MRKEKLKVKDKRKNKKLNVKKTSLYWVYFVFGGLIILLSLFFAPFWKEISDKIPWANWYSYALGGLVAAAILYYMFTILLKKLKNKDLNKTVRIIFGVEFSLLAFFAICSVVKAILNDNEKFDFLNTCEIIGLAIWIRGCVEMINAYYYDAKSTQKYPIWYLAINIGLVTFGPLVFSIGIIYRENIELIVSYSLCSIIFILGVFSCVWGGLSKPIKIVEVPVEEQKVELVEQKDVEILENSNDNEKDEVKNESLENNEDLEDKENEVQDLHMENENIE